LVSETASIAFPMVGFMDAESWRSGLIVSALEMVTGC